MHTRQSPTPLQSVMAIPVHWPSKPMQLPIFQRMDEIESSPGVPQTLSEPPHAPAIFAFILSALSEIFWAPAPLGQRPPGLPPIFVITFVLHFAITFDTP